MSANQGFNAKLYRSTATRATWNATVTNGLHVGAAPGTLDLVPNVKDIAIPMELSEGDVTTRGSGGYEVVLPSLAKVSIDIPMVYDTADADFIAFMTAWLTRAVIPLAILDGLAATAGTIGFWADFAVLKGEKSEPLDGAQMWTWTVKPGYSAVAPEWVKVA